MMYVEKMRTTTPTCSKLTTKISRTSSQKTWKYQSTCHRNSTGSTKTSLSTQSSSLSMNIISFHSRSATRISMRVPLEAASKLIATLLIRGSVMLPNSSSRGSTIIIKNFVINIASVSLVPIPSFKFSSKRQQTRYKVLPKSCACQPTMTCTSGRKARTTQTNSLHLLATM